MRILLKFSYQNLASAFVVMVVVVVVVVVIIDSSLVVTRETNSPKGFPSCYSRVFAARVPEHGAQTE